MTKRCLVVGVCVLAGLAATNGAIAQTRPEPPRVPSAAPGATGSTVPAPATTRRQPRASDIPDRSDAIDPSASSLGALDDTELQRKISGICKGC